jgi:N-acetylmuramoyl-L-alanine amidase
MKRLIIILPLVFGIAAIIAFAAPTPKDKIILIDAGHGGHDSGSELFDGTFEKDATLYMANYLNENIGKGTGIITKLTRTDDVFMPLDERANFSMHNVDLLVSLHSSHLDLAKYSGITIHCPQDGDFSETSLLYATRIATYLESNGINVRISNRNRYYMLAKVFCPSLMISADGISIDGESSGWNNETTRSALAEAIKQAIYEN